MIIRTTHLRITSTITLQIQPTVLFPLAISQSATITAHTPAILVPICRQNGITTAHILQVLTMQQATTIVITIVAPEVILT